MTSTTVVEQLGDAIATLAAHLHAATYELLVLLRQFDEQAGWNNGFLSCAHWLHWRTGIDLGAAREKVRVARALVALPSVSDAMQAGRLSYAKVRALTRIATAENEERLVNLALCATAAQVERLVRAWRHVDRLEAARETARRHRARHLSVWVDEDGMVVVRGRLTPEQGAMLQRALEWGGDELYRRGASPSVTALEETTTAQRRADALSLVAESCLQHTDGGRTADRYQVVVHVEPATLVSGGDTGQAVVETDHGGVRVSAETAQRLACDASVIVMHHDAAGTVLDVGRKRRTVPPAIHRALIARDPACQFPGCSSRRCDAHHVVPWADGGATRLDNLVRLCRRHHRMVHEGGYTLMKDSSGVRIIYPDGRLMQTAVPELRTTRELPAASSALHPYACTPQSFGERLDVGWAIDVLRT